MMETISVYFTPLASTKIAAYVGLGLAYHAAVVYTDATGTSFGASSGPSDQRARQTPMTALQAVLHSRTNQPSVFGTLLSDPLNNHPFIQGTPEDYYTQDDTGEPYPHVVVLRSANLSATWQTILNTYARVGRLKLTYSPISQNSNSMMGTALRTAGVAIPFSSATKFTPGAFTDLLRFARDRCLAAGRPATPACAP